MSIYFLGIFAYLNYLTPRTREEILKTLINGLHRLEYRGYDSAGYPNYVLQHLLYIADWSKTVFFIGMNCFQALESTPLCRKSFLSLRHREKLMFWTKKLNLVNSNSALYKRILFKGFLKYLWRIWEVEPSRKIGHTCRNLSYQMGNSRCPQWEECSPSKIWWRKSVCCSS